MSQILLIGGKKDGEIVDREFIENGSIPSINTQLVSSRIGGHADPVKPVDMSVTQYHMSAARIDGKRYAYATCRSIHESEVIDLIKASNLQPLE